MDRSVYPVAICGYLAVVGFLVACCLIAIQVRSRKLRCSGSTGSATGHMRAVWAGSFPSSAVSLTTRTPPGVAGRKRADRAAILRTSAWR